MAALLFWLLFLLAACCAAWSAVYWATNETSALLLALKTYPGISSFKFLRAIASILVTNSGLAMRSPSCTKFGVKRSLDFSITGNVRVTSLGLPLILKDWLIRYGLILGMYPVSIIIKVSAKLFLPWLAILESSFAILVLKKLTDGRNSIANRYPGAAKLASP